VVAGLSGCPSKRNASQVSEQPTIKPASYQTTASARRL
jgi:hypothetical protein